MGWERSNRPDLDPMQMRWFFYVGDFVYITADEGAMREYERDQDFRRAMIHYHEVPALCGDRARLHHRYLPLPLEPREGFGI